MLPPDPPAARGSSPQSPPQWKPLGPLQRRIIGVLVEKAKTTPDAYPLTLNSLTTGCNQKSNRYPQMHLSADTVEEALEQLRNLSAVVEVHSDGRVAKYRHRMYEWLGVDKTQLAVLAELLLRGEQSVGELRARAARMEPIADQAALKPILESLMQMKLVVALTRPGRGQVVTHGLYPPEEWQKLSQRYAQASPPPGTRPVSGGASRCASPPIETSHDDTLVQQVNDLRTEVAQLREMLHTLQQQVEGGGERP